MSGMQPLRGLSTVNFWAADLAAAKAWYAELLGVDLYNRHYLEMLNSTGKA